MLHQAGIGVDETELETVMITDANDYFAKGCGRCDRSDTPDFNALRWHDGLQELRQMCLALGLEEVAKWAGIGPDTTKGRCFRRGPRIGCGFLMSDAQSSGRVLHHG